MTVKTNGAEIKAFYMDQAFWPEDRKPNDQNQALEVWHEEVRLLINEQPTDDASRIHDLADTDKVTIVDGWVIASGENGFDVSFETYFKRWRRAQKAALASTNVTLLSVTAPNDKLEAIKAAIIAAGGKVG